MATFVLYKATGTNNRYIFKLTNIKRLKYNYAKAYDIAATFQYRTMGNPSGAQKTAELENIVTTHYELYKANLFEEAIKNPAAKEVQDYASTLN